MSARRLVLALLLLACGFAAGLVITGRIDLMDDAGAQVATPPAVRTPGPPGAALPDFTAVAERTVPAVVNIASVQVVRRPNSPFANDPLLQFFFGGGDDLFGRSVENSLGSGVIVSTDGYVLTNNHVVTGQARNARLQQLPQITVSLADRRELDAAIVGVDPDTDLALLKVDASDLPTIPWGDSDGLKVAEWVLAIGNPFQLNQTVTLGIVSALQRRVGLSIYEDFIQTDAAINPGNSGGALVNARGELVGINTAIFSQSGGYQGIGFAVPSTIARQVAADLQAYGQVPRGTMGVVRLVPLTTQIAAQLGVRELRGVVVQAVRRDSPAYAGGLRAGDIVIRFDGTEIVDGSELPRLVRDAEIGSTATVVVIRDGRERELRIPIQSTVQ